MNLHTAATAILSYALQSGLLLIVGLLLPRLIRLRHPRTMLIYWRVLLIVVLLIPLAPLDWARQAPLPYMTLEGLQVEEVVATEGTGHPMGPIFHLEVEVAGSTISARLNGRVLFGGELLDSGLASGTVGFYGWGSEPIEFDNAQVFATCP